MSFSITVVICIMVDEITNNTILRRFECWAKTRTLIGGCILIHSCSARRISSQIDEFEFDLKRNSSAEHEYMNIHPPPKLTF